MTLCITSFITVQVIVSTKMNYYIVYVKIVPTNMNMNSSSMFVYKTMKNCIKDMNKRIYMQSLITIFMYNS